MKSNFYYIRCDYYAGTIYYKFKTLDELYDFLVFDEENMRENSCKEVNLFKVECNINHKHIGKEFYVCQAIMEGNIITPTVNLKYCELYYTDLNKEKEGFFNAVYHQEGRGKIKQIATYEKTLIQKIF